MDVGLNWVVLIASKNLIPFTRTVPENNTTHNIVWDGYFLHGELYVFQSAVALIKMLEPLLLEASLADCMKLLRSPPHEILNQNTFVNTVRLIRIPDRIKAYYQLKKSGTNGQRRRSSLIRHPQNRSDNMDEPDDPTRNRAATAMVTNTTNKADTTSKKQSNQSRKS